MPSVTRCQNFFRRVITGSSLEVDLSCAVAQNCRVGCSSSFCPSGFWKVKPQAKNHKDSSGGKLATLSVGVVGPGTVTSLPVAISCTATGGTCVATYSVGASVLLTASAANVVWGNCPGSTGNTFAVTI